MEGREKRIVEFSVIIPVYNEEKYIPFSFPTLFDLDPSEVVVILDRCEDNSASLIDRVWEKKGKKCILSFMSVEYEVDWVRRVGYLKRKGYTRSAFDTILSTDADMVLDPNIRGHIGEIDKNTKLIKFGFYDHPLNVKSCLRQLYAKFTPFKPYSGLYAFSKQTWLETEDVHDASKKGGEDAHLQLAIEKKHKTRYVSTNSLHLRSNETVEHDTMRGKNYAVTVGASVLKVFLMSLMLLRPHMFNEYMKWRKYENVQK